NSLNLFNPMLSNLSGAASNTTGALTGAQQATLNDIAQRAALEQASLFSGSGRYGSEGMGIGGQRGVNEATNALTAQFNQQNVANALAANQEMGGMIGTGGQLRQAAAQGALGAYLGGTQGQLATRQAQAQGELATRQAQAQGQLATTAEQAQVR